MEKGFNYKKPYSLYKGALGISITDEILSD